MQTKILLLALALGASTCLLSAQDNPPPPDREQAPKAFAGPDNRGGEPGGRDRAGHGGLHLLPPGAQQKLDLTDDQQKQLAAVEAKLKAKLARILTPEQMKQLEQMRPPRQPGGGRLGEAGHERGMRGGPGGHGEANDHEGPPPHPSDE